MRFSGKCLARQRTVITSYSIHYTKLYDRTSRALSENHTTRPNSRYAHTLHRISLGLGASEVQACLLFAVSGPTAHPRGIKIGPAECGLSTQRVGAAFWAARYSITKISTPVGFEPTRGNPIGLAGRRLNRSAKVSSACCQALNPHAQAKAPNTHTRYRYMATQGAHRVLLRHAHSMQPLR